MATLSPIAQQARAAREAVYSAIATGTGQGTYLRLQRRADHLKSLVVYLAQHLAAPADTRLALLREAGLQGYSHLVH